MISSLAVCVAGWCLLVGEAAANPLAGVEAVFDRPQALAAAAQPAVCILDTEHPDVVREKVKEKGIPLYKCRVLQRRVAEITGLPCILVHYSEVSWREFDNPHIKAILLMAQRNRMNDQLQAKLYEFLRRNRTPLIGFCGGLQMIAEAFGGRIAPMRKLKPGETDTNPKYYPGQFKEWGFMPVRILERDPLLAGFADTLTVKEMHAYEVTKLPAELRLLASTDECRVEIAKHRDRLLYGTQFHPEAYDDEHLDGKTLLTNFFRMAGAMKAGWK
jgi:GMP synthase (glutamine-hydrolysing)